MQSKKKVKQNPTIPKGLYSARTIKPISNSKGLYSLKIEQRRKNLEEERRKLALAKEKLRRDMKSIEEEKNYVLEQDKKLESLETDMSKTEVELEEMSIRPGGSELVQQKTLLQKTAADLRQQIAIAQEELELAKKKNDDSTMEYHTHVMLQNKIAEKTLRVEKLRDLLNTLNTEVLTRENEVMEMELQAIEHKELVEKAAKQKEELLHRQHDAEEEKQKLVASIKAREKQRKNLADQSQETQKQLTEARNYSLELQELSNELDQKEHDLQLRTQNLEQLKTDLEKKRAERINAEMKRKEERESMKNTLSSLTPNYDTDIDSFDLERLIEQDQRSLTNRRETLKVERENYEQSYEEKKKKSLVLLADLRKRLKEAGNEETLESQMKQITETNSKLESEIAEKKRQIEELKKQILSDEEMNQRETDLQNKLKAVILQEKNINNRLTALQTEEDELDNDEDVLLSTREEIESEKKMLKLKMDSSEKMYSIYQQQLSAAQDRLKNLTLQLQHIEASK